MSVALLFLAVCCSSVFFGVQSNRCVISNKTVDWFSGFKYPRSYDYVFTSSDNPSVFSRAPNNLQQTSGHPVGDTLAQLYANLHAKRGLVVMYNDEFPTQQVKFTGGHMKGAFSFNQSEGFWLIHSVPKFPGASDYQYLHTEWLYGQNFFCVSLNTQSSLDKIITQLLIGQPWTFSHSVSDAMQRWISTHSPDLEQKLSDLVNNKHTHALSNAPPYRQGHTFQAILLRPPPIITARQSQVSFSSMAGVQFTHFAKSPALHHDLYDAQVAPALRSDLYAETWILGSKKAVLPSNCSAPYKVYKVSRVDLVGAQIRAGHSLTNSSSSFESTRDHSKWAVTASGTPGFVCACDMNRETTQFKRGGGALCFKDSHVWKLYHGMVNDFERCD